MGIKNFLGVCLLTLPVAKDFKLKSTQGCHYEILNARAEKVADVQQVQQTYLEGSYPRPNSEKMVEGAIKTYFLDSCKSAPGLVSYACGEPTFETKMVGGFIKAQAEAFAFPQGEKQKRIKFYKSQDVDTKKMQVTLWEIVPVSVDEKAIKQLETYLGSK